MRRIVILGAGGYGQVVADILLRARDAGEAISPLGYLDDNPSLTGQHLLGLPVLGPLAHLSTIGHDAVLAAIGHNRTRERLFLELRRKGECFDVARHPSAVIAPDVQIDSGSMISAGVIVNPVSVVGANVILNTGCTIAHHVHIRDHAQIADGVHMGGEVTIEEGVLVGVGATIMPRVRIGGWSVVGAGACVTKSVPPGITVVGVPARPFQ